VVVEALVNRDKSQYGGSDDLYDAKLLLYFIDHLLLQQRYPLPLPANLPPGIVMELHHHHVIGAGSRRSRWGAEAEPINPTVRGILGWLWRWLVWLNKR
jgi:hypothetical protein